MLAITIQFPFLYLHNKANTFLYLHQCPPASEATLCNFIQKQLSLDTLRKGRERVMEGSKLNTSMTPRKEKKKTINIKPKKHFLK